MLQLRCVMLHNWGGEPGCVGKLRCVDPCCTVWTMLHQNLLLCGNMFVAQFGLVSMYELFVRGTMVPCCTGVGSHVASKISAKRNTLVCFNYGVSCCTIGVGSQVASENSAVWTRVALCGPCCIKICCCVETCLLHSLDLCPCMNFLFVVPWYHVALGWGAMLHRKSPLSGTHWYASITVCHVAQLGWGARLRRKTPLCGPVLHCVDHVASKFVAVWKHVCCTVWTCVHV